MARTFRSQFDGAIYHLTVRCNNRQPLFREDKDRERYLELLHRYRDLFGYRLYAYILLTNHLQLLLETPRGNVSKVMQCLGTNYASYFNPTRVEFPAACGVKEIGNSIPDTPLLAAG